MVILCIVLAVVAGITTGWAAKQREQILEQEERIVGLLIENSQMEIAIASSEVCLKMVLDETEKSA